MNPLSLKAINLRSYPSVEWDIPEGITALIGANGAGKSTLLQGVELALFADGARDLAPALGPFDTSLEILLEFEHAGHTFRVRRTYSSVGRGKASLDFEISHAQPHHTGDDWGPGWEPLTRESAKETQELIERTLGLSRATFNASAFCSQRNSGAWPEADPAKRKAVLGEILDPAGLWPALAERAAGERKALETDLASAEARMADRTEQAAERPALEAAQTSAELRVDTARMAYNGTEEILERTQARLAANEAAAERLRAATKARAEAENRRDNAADALREAQAQAEQLPGAQAALAVLAARSAEVPGLERKAEAQSKALAEQAVARERKQAAEREAKVLLEAFKDAQAKSEAQNRQRDALGDQISHLEEADAGAERCALCSQILGAEAKAATLERLSEQLEALNLEIISHAEEVDACQREAWRSDRDARAIEIPDVDLADYSAPLAAARKAGEERAALEVEIGLLERAERQLGQFKQNAAFAEAELAKRAAESASLLAAQQDSAELERAASDARDRQRQARAALDEASADLVRAQEALARVREAVAELAKMQAEAAESRARLALLRLAERACGRDGVPALIAENACGSIEAEANRVLEQLPTASGTVFRVELRTQRALKSDAAAMRETLDILVSDRQTTREFLTFSGGEQWRVAFALRWALARLLAGRRGAESRLLVIDEPDGLDAGGMDGLAAVLHEGAATFDRILVVSHSPLLASAFEQVVEIESDGEASRIASAREEAVV